MGQGKNDLMIGRSAQAVRVLAVILSMIIYVCFVAYSEFHFYNLVTNFIPDGLMVVGLIAVAVSAITAVALPLSLHFWFRQGLQQVAGFVFYGAHFLIVIANLIVDGALVAGAAAAAAASTADNIVAAPQLHGIYGTYILPAYIALYGLGWSILWFLDDGSQRLDKLRDLQDTLTDGKISRRIDVTNMQGEAIKKAFKSSGAQKAVNRWAAMNAPKLLAEELGMTVDELGEDGDYQFWTSEEKDERPSAPQAELAGQLAALIARLEGMERSLNTMNPADVNRELFGSGNGSHPNS